MRARLLALAGFLCAAAAAAVDQTITVGPGISFSPSTVSISTGDTVTWTWAAASLPHSTTSDATTGPEVWDSGVQTAGSFTHTFNTAGNYAFHCQVHSFAGGTAMNGVVQVAAAATPTATATPTPTPPPPPVTPTPGAGAAIPALSETGRVAFVAALALAAVLWLAVARPR
jgi:plastocyanin